MNNVLDTQLNFLRDCVSDYKIFMDTSSLLQESADKFFQNIVPILEREGKSIIVPLCVCLEIEKFAKDPVYCRRKYSNNPSLNVQAIRVLKTLERMHNAQRVSVLGDSDDGNFADNVFIRVFTGKRLEYDMLLITQDRGLASEILRLGKDNQAVRGVKKIRVQQIDKNGFLQPLFGRYAEVEIEDIPLNERFAFAKEVTQITGNLSVNEIPVEGDPVTAVRNGKTKQIHLRDKIGEGGEGSVYRTDLRQGDQDYVAKIYKPEEITRLRYEKIKLMLTKDIDCEGVCFPLAMILNQRNEFVGYLMKAASGRDLGKSVFMPELLKKYFPNWNKGDTVQLCVTILKKLKYLHDRNVILGDINPYNILVVSPKEVYFVDTDSYQVEGFACPVGMPLFTAPELQGKPYSTFLRTLGNENFAVATLLFMIMHPGKPPYSMQDGAGIVANIKNGEFPYPLGELKTGKAPKGPWRFCWSHLPRRTIKEYFYQTFWRDGTFHGEKERPGTGTWLQLFEDYLNLLKSGKMAAQDEESLKIFPTRLKRNINKTYANCKLCGNECDEDYLQEGICPACLKVGEVHHCADCGREMIYTNYQKYIKHAKRYKICHDCYEKRNMVYERRICRNCGKEFEITVGEKKFCDETPGMVLPTRCENCRGKSKTSAAIDLIFS